MLRTVVHPGLTRPCSMRPGAVAVMPARCARFITLRRLCTGLGISLEDLTRRVDAQLERES